MKTLKPCVIWFTGLSGAGKSSLACEVQKLLFELDIKTSLLDGDIVRQNLCKDLSFSKEDREENIRRVGQLARKQLNEGNTVLCAFISPFKHSRDQVRELFKEGEFLEVFVDTPLDICEQRDIKGLYKKARAGEIQEFTGIDSPYESPLTPEIHIKSTLNTHVKDSAKLVMNYLHKLFHVV